jgi:hypothetical protein
MKKINIIKNRKGIDFLGGHTLNLVIAVICIGFLIYLGVRIYYVFTDKGDLDKANNNLKNFVLEYKDFIASTQTEKEFMILGNADWYIIFYSREGSNPDYLVPIDCKDYQNCVCMCEGDLTGSLVEKCDKKNSGVCFDLESKWIGPPYPYEIKQIPFTIKVTKPQPKTSTP